MGQPHINIWAYDKQYVSSKTLSPSQFISSVPFRFRVSTVAMYRTAASRARALKGSLSRSLRPARYASSSAVATSSSSSSPGFFSWLTGGSSSSLNSLDMPLQGVSLPPPLADLVEPSKLKITTLPNGLKIASEMSPNPAASIGLYVDCGSIYEAPYFHGATHLLERMAFKSTRNRSHLRLVREIEAIGGNTSASASREQMSYTIDALKTYVPEMVEVLIDSVRNPAFLDWEVNEELRKMKLEIAELANNPMGLLMEAVHSAGYSGALANPLYAPESALDRLNGELLEEFMAENFTAARMVLAASGVEHEELLKVVEPLTSDLPNVTRQAEPKSQYTGGDFRQHTGGEATHFALAFEVPGWNNEKEAVIATVLQMLMGGGGSFSAGGPGKGMHSWLYLRILNEYQQVQSCTAFSSIFNNTGLFGIYGCSSPEFAAKAIELAAKEMKDVAGGKVNQKHLDRAKAATKSAVLMNLESRMIAAEDIGRQILTYGERKPVEQFLKTVDGLTLKDITDFTSKIISKPLTMGSFGDVLSVPSYDTISSKFS
ncbi:probable mitochondrial-processing peptidase subunit alpha-1, mitochondrial [Brassica rapa]|nr:probable mitochondrial-processing peptidase subunit alpha-1, mitochondrial [Brassica rapa]